VQWIGTPLSRGRRRSAPKVIAAVVGIIGIALLAFSDPMRKLVDNFGPIQPLCLAAHLAIENQKGLTNEPLPLGISVVDGSGGETVTLAGMPEGTDLSFGTALGSGSWVVPVADFDKTFVGAPMSFVGAMKDMPAQAEAIPAPLSDATIGTPSQGGSAKTRSPSCLISAADVRKLTPHAWPKWTYGPSGERCWYSGEKPVFAKAPK
jgi:hypothetical protein